VIALLLLSTGQKNMYFNLRAILGWLSVAMLHALIILLVVLLGADGMEADRFTGITWGLQQNGVLMFSIVVITVHLQLAVSIDQWTWLHHFSIWGSICELPPGWAIDVLCNGCSLQGSWLPASVSPPDACWVVQECSPGHMLQLWPAVVHAVLPRSSFKLPAPCSSLMVTNRLAVKLQAAI
jgi:hypothetical protein